MSAIECAIAAAVQAAVAPLADEVRQLRASVEALAERDDDPVGGIAELAMWLGCSKAAAKARVHRDGDLAGLAFRVGSRRRWRRRDVELLLEARR